MNGGIMLGGGSASCIELWIYLELNRVIVITSQAILIAHYYVFVIMTMKGFDYAYVSRRVVYF